MQATKYRFEINNPHSPKTTPKTRVAIHGARTRVLVVDDNVCLTDMLALILERAGLEVARFYDALAAAQYALDFEPHVVITDYSMPHMNGLELATWLHIRCPNCKIMIITGEAAAVKKQASNGLKFTLFQKPIDSRALIAAVKQASEGDCSL